MDTNGQQSTRAIARTDADAEPQSAVPFERDTLRVAKAFAQSGFFKDAAGVAQAVVKIMAGAELGFGPVASMTGIHIVEGKVTLSANLIAAAIKRSQRYDYRVRELTDDACRIEFFERGEAVGLSDFTMDDARKANLAGKGVWKSYPRNMLFARTMSNGARFYCADVFGGPVYTPEELDVPVDADGSPQPVAARQSAPALPAGEMSAKAKAVVAEMDAAVAESEPVAEAAAPEPSWAGGADGPAFLADVQDIFARACAQGLLPTFPPVSSTRVQVDKWLTHWRREVALLEAPDPNIAALAKAKARAEAAPENPATTAAKERVAERVEQARIDIDAQQAAAWEAGLPDEPPPAADPVDALADAVSTEAGVVDDGERPLTGWEAVPDLMSEVSRLVDELSVAKAKDGQPIRFVVPPAATPVVEVRQWCGQKRRLLNSLKPAN